MEVESKVIRRLKRDINPTYYLVLICFPHIPDWPHRLPNPVLGPNTHGYDEPNPRHYRPASRHEAPSIHRDVSNKYVA